MSMHRKGTPVPQRERDVVRAFVALAGPPLLYVSYFGTIYLLGEAGCKVGAFGRTLLGSPAVTTLAFFLSVTGWLGLLLLARLARRVNVEGDESRELASATGQLLAALSALLIAATLIFVLVFPPC